MMLSIKNQFRKGVFDNYKDIRLKGSDFMYQSYLLFKKEFRKSFGAGNCFIDVEIKKNVKVRFVIVDYKTEDIDLIVTKKIIIPLKCKTLNELENFLNQINNII